jgi:hypothetical protein
MERKWLPRLCQSEREKFATLSTDNERQSFRIIRNWSQTDEPDFYIVCEQLSHRLGVSIKTASTIRRRFVLLGILRQTAPYVAHKLAARYQWIA